MKAIIWKDGTKTFENKEGEIITEKNMLENKYTNSNGTSFFGSTIRTTVRRLKEVIGEVSFEDNTGTDKVNIEWSLTLNNTEPITIYDYMEYRKIDEDEYITFKIGGNNKYLTSLAKDEILKLL
tara:strand:- start:62 stop:433 length:372 start_codon:yes stop_codon:yes gene_type:complete